MQKLMINYLKPTGFFLISLVSVGIISSYFLVPHDLAVSLTDFYSQYWHTLTVLFVIALIYLSYVLAITHTKLVKLNAFVKHLVAISLLVLFCYELLTLYKVSNIIYAML